MNQYFTDSMTFTKTEPRHKLCMRDGMVTLQQRAKDNFAVRYGKEVHSSMTYAQVCTELGKALMHQLACDGLLDNRMPGERL